MKKDVFRPAQVADLLGDLLPETNIGRRAAKVIKIGLFYGVGIRRDTGNGRWEYSINDVDILRRKLEEHLPYTVSVKEMEALTGKPSGTIISQAHKLGVGQHVGSRLMFKPEDVDRLAVYNGRRGKPMQEKYAVENGVLTVTKIAELVRDDFPHLTTGSLQDKIRRFAQQGVVGKRDDVRNMWVFSQDDVRPLVEAMRGGLGVLRAV